MSNLPSLLGGDNDINTLTIRDNQYSKITDMKKTTGLNNIWLNFEKNNPKHKQLEQVLAK